jgi:hypothetical protein
MTDKPTETKAPAQQKFYTPRHESEIVSDESISAIDLMPPDTFDVQYKVPGIRCRWVNYRSRDGQMLAQAQAEGFEFCSPNDVNTTVAVKEGRFYNGDVVLMKIAESRYAAAIKSVVLRSKLAAGKSYEKAQDELHQLGRKSGGQLIPYTPDEKDLDRMIQSAGTK